MNLLLIYESELVSDSRATVTGSRARDLIEWHEVRPGIEVQVGVENGLIGTARIETVSSTLVELSLSLERRPPPKKDIIAVVAVRSLVQLSWIRRHRVDVDCFLV